jgi:hypothetical protein
MSHVNGEPLKLWQARCAFTRAVSQLVQWADDDSTMLGFEVAFGEGLVAITDGADGDYDGPHKRGGSHYNGLGVDLVIYDTTGGRYISDGAHLAYRRLGEKWRRLHWLARWGGDFTKPDPNHFSFTWEGKA